MTLRLIPERVSLDSLRRILRDGVRFEIAPEAHDRVAHGARVLERRIAAGDVLYGVNTGFGKLANVRIDDDKLAELQRNLVRSHCAGFGAPLSAPIVRLIIALKCISLGRGASGVRPEVIHLLQRLVDEDVLPVIPEKGSVGASGDLAPLAHLAATLIGEGEAFHRGVRMSSAAALRAAGLAPLELRAKEGLALLNGTQVSTALALSGIFDAWQLAWVSLTTTALSVDAAAGSTEPFRPEIHRLRGQRGQIECARRLASLLAGSAIVESHRVECDRVQDPYCLRCAPQVIGACIDQLRHAARTLAIEANAATDNPLVLPNGAVASGGNFHAEPVALVADQIAIVIAELGSIAQRRIALLVDPTLSFGLPAFLAADPGLCSGMMIAEVTSAALMSENRSLANPRSIDSTPTSANQEDHVSMACHAARRLGEMNDNLAGILAVEAMTAVQGIELRAPLTTSRPLQRMVTAVRRVVATLNEDRIVSPDLQALATWMRTETVDVDVPALSPEDVPPPSPQGVFDESTD
ncbi:MAG: histidine ammonia-lyase [Myxococcota bacterium]